MTEKKALLPQHMCTCAEREGREKSRGLICVSVPGFVMGSSKSDDPGNRKLYLYKQDHQQIRDQMSSSMRDHCVVDPVFSIQIAKAQTQSDIE